LGSGLEWRRVLLALLLLRRRVLRLDETEQAGEEQGTETMIFYCGRNETEYRVSVVTPLPERVNEIQEELAQLLFGSES